MLGVLPGIIGSIQATETLKLLLGIGEPLVGRFLIFDALRMKFRELKLRKDPDCPVCGTHPTVTALIDYEQFCGVAGSREEAPTAAASGSDSKEITVLELKARLDRGEDVFVLDVRELQEYEINRIPGSVADPARRAAAAVHGARRQPSRSSPSASRASAARRRPSSCARRASGGEEPQGRHARLGRRGRSDPAEVRSTVRAGLKSCPTGVSARSAQYRMAELRASGPNFARPIRLLRSFRSGAEIPHLPRLPRQHAG